MSDWSQELAAAEAQAERFQVVESHAEEKFQLVREQAQQTGDAERALESPEFRQWMDARRATDLAWSSWALLKDAS